MENQNQDPFFDRKDETEQSSSEDLPNEGLTPTREEPVQANTEEAPSKVSAHPKQASFSIGAWLGIICLLLVVAVLLTYTLTSASERSYYTAKLEAQQQKINLLQNAQKNPNLLNGEFSSDQLDVLAAIFETYSYYAGSRSEEELMTAVLKAYAAATGDLYAEYYTEEEYAELSSQNAGDYEGIGVSVIQKTLTVNGMEYAVFEITAIYKNSPAQNSNLKIGDYIYCVKVDETYQTISALGGYTAAINQIRGEKGTYAEFAVFRKSTADQFETIEIRIMRDAFETVSVTPYLAENDPSIGIIHISEFDLTTPRQFKEAVLEMQAKGVEHFVFDVRYNPGGDLQSIKAVLSYFLQKGDLILSSIDKNGVVAKSYYAEPTSHFGTYAPCNVAEEELGMFADLDMVVLCNGGTASAAEVFTATLRDYGLAEVVGETTFGKGVMQSYLPMSAFGNYSGYVKLTTYAYVTQCGVTYHDLGIKPTVGEEIPLSEEALTYNFYVLPQSIDNQLQAALAQFKS